MSSEIKKGVGITAIGIGLLVAFATVIGVSNGHIFTQLTSAFAPGGLGAVLAAGGMIGLVGSGIAGVSMIAGGARKTKKAWDEYQALKE